jgi:hypothetical protein
MPAKETVMHPRFEAYRKDPLGKAIESLANKSQRPIEYVLLSRLNMPAVIALSWDVKPLLRNLSEAERREAKQFCGAVVGDIMRDRGYEIVNPRGSAQAGGVFTLGAVWGLADADTKGTIQVASDVMDEYKATLKELAK